MPFFIVNAFPSNYRVFAVGFAYNLSQAVFAGPTPVLSSTLAKVLKIIVSLPNNSFLIVTMTFATNPYVPYVES